MSLLSIFVYSEFTLELLYLQGTQLTIWQVIECAESHPYLIKDVTYGHGRFERTKYVRPNVGNLRPCDADKYIPLFQNLIAAHRQKKKTIRKYDKK